MTAVIKWYKKHANSMEDMNLHEYVFSHEEIEYSIDCKNDLQTWKCKLTDGATFHHRTEVFVSNLSRLERYDRFHRCLRKIRTLLRGW